MYVLNGAENSLELKNVNVGTNKKSSIAKTRTEWKCKLVMQKKNESLVLFPYIPWCSSSFLHSQIRWLFHIRFSCQLQGDKETASRQWLSRALGLVYLDLHSYNKKRQAETATEWIFMKHMRRSNMCSMSRHETWFWSWDLENTKGRTFRSGESSWWSQQEEQYPREFYLPNRQTHHFLRNFPLPQKKHAADEAI